MDTETRFRLFRILFSIAGNPLLGDGQSLAYRIYSIVTVTFGYGCWIGEVIATFTHLDNIEEMLESARVAIPVTACIWIDSFIRFRKHSIENLIRRTEQFVWEDCPQREGRSGRLTMAGVIPRIQKAMALSMWLVLGSHSVYMFVRGIGSEKLGLTMWTPFDARPSPVHEITIIVQVLSTVVNTSNFLGFVGLYATLVSIACSQLEKLQAGLKNFRKEKLQKHDTDQEKLRENIRLHQSVLSFMRAIEDILNTVVFGHFLIIIGTLCFGAISATATLGQGGELMQIMLIIFCMGVQLGVYCWFGEQLTYQAQIIKQAAWDSEWVGAPLNQQGALMFMTAAANQHFALTAGGFISLSQHTMIKVLNQVMSYTMFLINVREDNDRI